MTKYDTDMAITMTIWVESQDDSDMIAHLRICVVLIINLQVCCFLSTRTHKGLCVQVLLIFLYFL
jgi:hypothetical protein